MILVSYDPFALNGGTIYVVEENGSTEYEKNIKSTINSLAYAAIKAAYQYNQYDIQFQPHFGADTQEFADAINYLELLKYNENKITVSEVK